MSAARALLLSDISAIRDALSLGQVTAGAGATGSGPGIAILRRGMMITGLITLETFIRGRTEEILKILENWPASYQDLPAKLREAALLDALTNVYRYARITKRAGGDFESEIISQIKLMSMTTGPAFGFTKFIAGDFTGNISDEAIKDLLSLFQIRDCWNSFRLFSADVGFGVPSVHEILKAVIGSRHQSAHVSNYVPTVSSVTGLADDLTCVGICFDVAISAAAHYAIADWSKWSGGQFNWRNQVALFDVEINGSKRRIVRNGLSRAYRIVASDNEVMAALPAKAAGNINVAVWRNAAGKPTAWRVG